MAMSPVQKLLAEDLDQRELAIRMCELFNDAIQHAHRISHVVARFEHEIQLLRAEQVAEPEVAPADDLVTSEVLPVPEVMPVEAA